MRKQKTARPRVTHVEAHLELHKEPDWDKFAWALLRFTKMQREQREAANETTKSEDHQ